MPAVPNRILSKMLDRLFAALVNGPSLNCRPHSSRQRIDWTHLARLKDLSPEIALRQILSPDQEVKLTAKVPAPRRKIETQTSPAKEPTHENNDCEELTAELHPPSSETPSLELTDDKSAKSAFTEQSALLAKLRGIIEDAKTYEQDTGVHVLNIGFPLLTLPPGHGQSAQRSATRRIIAPIAFIPITLVLKAGASPGLLITCKGEGVDRVTPNTALLAWLEQQTGKKIDPDLFEDEQGQDPWQEISKLVAHVCKLMELPLSEAFTPPPPPPPTDPNTPPPPQQPWPIPQSLSLRPAPKTDESPDKPTIDLAAILGLFPVANQGLLRDMQAMNEGEPLAGPVTHFIHSSATLEPKPESTPTPQPAPPPAPRQKRFEEERLITQADPCQSQAVSLARESKSLVIHGPPGTGKSQTITNIIGDHLARGQRVLLVSDKRTALDVVANRLNHLDLGRLCAIIHDPQRDQRDLYRMIREQLESLPQTQTDPKAKSKLARLDAELQQLHKELTDYFAALHETPTPPSPGTPACGERSRTGEGRGEGLHPSSLILDSSSSPLHPSSLILHPSSFHSLVGRWLAIPDTQEAARLEPHASSLHLDELETHTHLLEETLDRVAQTKWHQNPWQTAAGIDIPTLIATPMQKWREALTRCIDAATACDNTTDPSIPPFDPNVDLAKQAQSRLDLAARLETVLAKVPLEIRTRWTDVDPPTRAKTRQKIADILPHLQNIRSAPLDHELQLIHQDRPPQMSEMASQLGKLEGYLQIAGKWYAFLQFKIKSAAREVVSAFGLPLNPQTALCLKIFLLAVRSRIIVQSLAAELQNLPPAPALLPDEVLDRTITQHHDLFNFLADFEIIPPAVLSTLKGNPTNLIEGLKKSPPRAQAITALLQSATQSRLFATQWLSEQDQLARQNPLHVSCVMFQSLLETFPDLESILRIRAALTRLPAPLSQTLTTLCQQPVDPQTTLQAMHKVALAAEITRRLATDTRLQNADGQRISSAFDRYTKLQSQKKSLVRDVILHEWTTRQKDRLLASTGTRLGALGAELKRRLTLRGQRAMRLRQVLAVGQNTDGGDPLFDICPVWMASPETVAQLFPRKEVFSVVIFDEASQCRLEETLSVLTRGQRVVIAGDPKQLPPTRFFESAVAQSEDDDIETDQQLFEAQQGEVEDLLGAALNLEIDQAYLDVHYRSRSAELIQFSNQHFYSSRLQPIPGHPDNAPQIPPLLLHKVNGIYEKRANPAEADKVVEIVQNLLKQKSPPSIGIACFNLQQRDLIVEKLDQAAADDDRFAKKLAEARTKEGKGSFEGLFVKNLENVQGDERDHIIISTTYGPDVTGRFYRRFGPLGRAGGGRRLNVLITRSRDAVHLVTSIPDQIYKALPPIPQGQAPTGGWLLFAYLKYAEEITKSHTQDSALSTQNSSPTPQDSALSTQHSSHPSSFILHPSSSPTPQDSGLSTQHSSPHPSSFITHPSSFPQPPSPTLHPTKSPSPFTDALAAHLAQTHNLPSEVYWGNEGFQIDIALKDPQNPTKTTQGILCDAARYPQAPDPVEWDVFRTSIHESQGWTLTRIWTPHYFRDPNATTQSLLPQREGEAPPEPFSTRE